jgi:hypothetical protein
MPAGPKGQQISLAAVMDANATAQITKTKATKNSTPATIAAGYSRPDLAATIAKLNNLRSSYAKFLPGQVVKLPGLSILNLDVLCDDIAPTITDGYAIFETVTRPGRTGVNKFDGYNPLEMVLTLDFEAFGDSALTDPGPGAQIEANIRTLERMAGRGQFSASGAQVPPVVRASCLDNKGGVVWLIPSSYQWSNSNKAAPQWRITDIAWDNSDPDSGGGSGSAPPPLRDTFGQRIRQQVVVTLTQYTPVWSAITSVSARAQAKASG